MSYDPDLRRDTPLARKIKERIRREGPITVAAYMDACLQDPEYGYYRTQTAIGAAGDFVTAPEISQVFGELIGLWCAVVWQQMGKPDPVHLVEFGPGRGTMMRDMLRAARLVPGFLEAATIHLVEMSEPLKAAQRATLGALHQRIEWHDHSWPRPSEPTIIVANEIIDCFPVLQMERRDVEGSEQVWYERTVTLDEDDRLQFGLGRALKMPPMMWGRGPTDLIREHRALDPFCSWFALDADKYDVAALFIDYGYTSNGFGDTLQAVRSHVAEHVFTSPGEADLTTQVNFTEVARNALDAGLTVDGPTTQAEFLGRLGIVERASKLMGANPAKAGEIEAGVMRLMAPNGMGTRFKAIGIRSPNVGKLPGF